MEKSTTFTGFLKLCKEHKIDDEAKYYKLRNELEQKFVDWHGPKTDDKGNPLISGKQSFINELNSLRLRKSEMAQKSNKSEVERLNQAIKDKGKELGVMEGKILQIKHHKGGVLYKDAPKYFTWLKDECRWKIRERLFNTLGRIYSVSPSDKTGRLELRILLHYVRSPTSYTDFLTYKHVCKTYQESCLERGLIEDDKVYNTIMEEAKEFKMPSAIRNLFALLLLNCEVKEPGRLWDKFKIEMIDDLKKKYKAYEHDTEMLYKIALFKILKKLKAEDSSQFLETYFMCQGPSNVSNLSEYVMDVPENFKYLRT
ncbi:hypothetical protein DdX_10004 [Ditylenchus destructor]|uniref:Uncharacterized protein n=1 Tax=Ditylenchus destructor TaxID=166010 RepID=A0AAD4MZB8_9BILA|nr:hypothetical protein DdX_10004 [Ditylenchus destructor]